MLTTYAKNSETRLLDLIAKTRDGSGGYYVVHFNFSRLSDHYKNEYQLKISVNIINDILREAEGYVFITSDFDIFVFCKSVLPNVVKKMIFQLRYLYMDDQLAYQGEGRENPDFCDIYELKIGWNDLFNIAKAKLERLEREIEKENYPITQLDDGGVLTPAKLASVEQELGKTNIAHAFRSQPVCAAKHDGFKVIFSEAYINIAALGNQLRTRVDLLSNRTLFRYLTQILDGKMLEFIAKNSRKYLQSALSINLNIETLLSQNFADFDKMIDEDFKKNIVIEINLGDVFSDMHGFTAARKILQDAGYRICLDGLNNLSFLQIDRETLGFDLAKIYWNADLHSDVKRKQSKDLVNAVKKCGASRVILARCDSKDAVYYGQSLGISLFQGRYIDSLLDPESEIVN